MPNTLISLDFVCCFQYKAEAEQFYRRLSKRMENFGLELEMSKSRLIEFGRYAEENRKCRGEGNPEPFTFLGLPHTAPIVSQEISGLKGKQVRRSLQRNVRKFID